LKNNVLHISYYLILVLSISLFSSCEEDLTNGIEKDESKIWVNAVVSINDTVRIYLGNTSGINSGDLARYRSDAKVKLSVNSGFEKELIYKKVPNSSYRGYYYSDRLENTKPGDSLHFEARIEGSNFKSIEGDTYIPNLVAFEINDLTKVIDGDKILIFLELLIDENNGSGKYFELKFKNFSYAEETKKMPSGIENITALNNLSISYGQTWNEKLKSVLIEKSKVIDNKLNVSFEIENNSIGNILEIEFRTVTKDYFYYFKALDGGNVIASNIKNGAGIFAGFSKSIKTIEVK